MAVANTFTFGSANSSTYGVVIEGPGNYSAAKRAVEMISIPGRNGEFALDKGHFENITVEYNVVIQNTTQATFETSVASFKNAIVSQKGYQRLTDTYHPNEYRMAVYAGGFDEDPAFHGNGAIFKVKFNCKPQRFLTSGETATTVANNGTMSNPTLFDSKPLLEVTGYGNIGINGETITVENGEVGTISLASKSANGDETITSLQITVDYSAYSSTVNAGDEIRGYFYTNNEIMGKLASGGSYYTISTIDGVASGLAGKSFANKDYFYTLTAFPSSNQTVTFTNSYAIVLSNNVSFTLTITRTITNSTSGIITFLDQVTTSTNVSSYMRHNIIKIETENVRILSTYSSLGNPTYIDLDIGEAYKISNNTAISLNDTVKIPAELPKLKPGTNTFTKANTVTQLKVVPRWWKI